MMIEEQENIMIDYKAERLKRGWTQEHLAIAAGIDARTVRRVETTGRGSPETEAALRAAMAIDPRTKPKLVDIHPYGTTPAFLIDIETCIKAPLSRRRLEDTTRQIMQDIGALHSFSRSAGEPDGVIVVEMPVHILEDDRGIAHADDVNLGIYIGTLVSSVVLIGFMMSSSLPWALIGMSALLILLVSYLFKILYSENANPFEWRVVHEGPAKRMGVASVRKGRVDLFVDDEKMVRSFGVPPGSIIRWTGSILTVVGGGEYGYAIENPVAPDDDRDPIDIFRDIVPDVAAAA
jgi:transcriptional regulator with XRE-family HTH domain